MLLEELIRERLQAGFDSLEPGADPLVRPSEHADYQANGVLALAKRLRRPPREVAAAVLEIAALDDICSVVEVSGPGFVNLTLSEAVIAGRLASMSADPALGVEKVSSPLRVVVDYSGPNVAKEMHVGHLRSTLIGDALCRMLDFVGHEVIRENHVGDWGTPFGMLIEHLSDLGEAEAAHELSVGDMGVFYAQARAEFDSSEEFRRRSSARVVLLQSGDPETLRLWRVLVSESLSYFRLIYARLGVLLTESDVVGESFYNPMLARVVEELDRQKLLVESDGALCVFPPGFVNRDGEPLPLIVRKADGGFGYAATDLAAIWDRTGRLGAQLLLYVVGIPQSQHLAMSFQVAEMAGWLVPPARAEHVEFGSVLGADGRLLRTRSGDTVKLADLLDEAIERAEAVVAERSGHLEPETRQEVARAVGIGAVKYADLSTERRRDYAFDWDRMLAFEGNTAPYLQYAHARICSIFRRADYQAQSFRSPLALLEPSERSLGLELARFDAGLGHSLDNWAPHRLCTYLYGLASTFTTFYESCPVLRAPDPELRSSRLALCDLTARVLKTGLGLLGIDAPEQL